MHVKLITLTSICIPNEWQFNALGCLLSVSSSQNDDTEAQYATLKAK